jgi:hypothetical protein
MEAMKWYALEEDGRANGESLFAIYEVGRHPDGGHPWVMDRMPLHIAEWVLAELASGLSVIEFINQNPDASWLATQMGYAMERGATYEQASAAYRGREAGRG